MDTVYRMTAQVLRPSRFAARWRYRYIVGSLVRYWSAHDRAPQIWRNQRWEDLAPARLVHPAPEAVQ
jgi:hypothetical protein